MGWFTSDSPQAEAHDQYGNVPHKADITHELLAGAAAFTAAKAYEEHCSKEGKPDNHALAKELLAGFIGAFVDREVETKGLDLIDKEKAKSQAREHTDAVVVQEYAELYVA